MSSEAPSSPVVQEARPQHGASRRLVLAEDDQDLRETLGLVLRRDGYEVIEIEDGSQLQWYLATHPPVDIVISDVRMPGKSGLEVLAAVKWARGEPPPFILVTAFCDDRTRAAAFLCGAAVLSKPFSLEAMRAQIRAVFSREVA